MSQFAANVAAGLLPNTMAVFGVPVTYRTGAGVSSGITAIPGEESQEEDQPGMGRRGTRTKAWTVQLADIAAPGLADSVTHGSDVWSVSKVDALGNGRAKLTCRLISSIEPGRQRKTGKR